MDFFQCTLKRHSIGGIMEKVQIPLFSSFLFELVKVIWQTTSQFNLCDRFFLKQKRCVYINIFGLCRYYLRGIFRVNLFSRRKLNQFSLDKRKANVQSSVIFFVMLCNMVKAANLHVSLHFLIYENVVVLVFSLGEFIDECIMGISVCAYIYST